MKVLQVLRPSGGGPSNPLISPGDCGLPVLPRLLDLKDQLFFIHAAWCFYLDQCIADMNKSVMQQMASQQASNFQHQVQAQQNKAVQMAHMDALVALPESIQ